MIYTDSELSNFILSIKDKPETEIIEFKEAVSNYSFNDIGKYFSALSNEANINEAPCGWLIFGITDNGIIKGTNFRTSGLQSLKKELAGHTNERLTFLNIYELKIENKRVIAFQIPPAIKGIPTTWNGAAFAREDESTCPLPINKLDIIRNQIGFDWSKEIVQGATIDDLDPEAIAKARELFIKKQRNPEQYTELSDEALLNKASILIKGKVTNAALILLGKPESSYLFDGFIPRITWTLYNGDNTIKTYEHFDMPLLLAVDKVYAKIRNEKYRYIAEQLTLFPDEVNQYEPEVIKEILNNCIAHSDYRLRGKINVEEFEDRIVFINEASFIPESIESTLEAGYKHHITEILSFVMQW